MPRARTDRERAAKSFRIRTWPPRTRWNHPFLNLIEFTPPFFFMCVFPDDSKGKRQRKILYKTQNYLNLYAADGLRTLCIAKKVTLTRENDNTPTHTHTPRPPRLHTQHIAIQLHPFSNSTAMCHRADRRGETFQRAVSWQASGWRGADLGVIQSSRVTLLVTRSKSRAVFPAC